MIPVSFLAGQKIALFGLGLSGLSAAHALQKGGAEIVAWDDREEARREAEKKIPLTDLAHCDWSQFKALILAPGVPFSHPEPHWTVMAAKAANIEIIGDMELFFRAHRLQGSKAKIVAITGTNGKSTTTALVTHILKTNHRPVAMGGNIGAPVLGLQDFSDDLTYVFELSSFQIDLTPTLVPDIACLLNITPDHLDRHGTFEHYAGVKERIFSDLSREGLAVISVDDTRCQDIAQRLAGSARREGYNICLLSCEKRVETGLSVSASRMTEYYAGGERAEINLAECRSLRGKHNWQNAAAAYGICRSLGCQPEEIACALKTFPGLVHRMEEVGQLEDMIFINDSKATNAEATAGALASFDDIYWIAGGRAKAGGLEGLESFYPRIQKAYLIGEAMDDFARCLSGKLATEKSGTLERAVRQAADDARRSDIKDAAILLSPACASYDQFANFEERGEAFRQAVAALDGATMGAGR